MVTPEAPSKPANSEVRSNMVSCDEAFLIVKNGGMPSQATHVRAFRIGKGNTKPPCLKDANTLVWEADSVTARIGSPVV